jgi:L-alanine-DL-glutamate epimerase-like enolase superfamily enzyme
MKITKIETTHCPTLSLGMIFCRIETDSGLVGYGESCYIPNAVSAVIHEWIAPRLMGANPLDIEGHWRFLYERAANFGARGAELRAISAIDLALWDILGKSCNLPVWQLLGGKTQERIRIYNSSGGPAYGGKTRNTITGSWPGYGIIGEKGPLNDYWMAVNEPAEYARELLSEGITATKLWSLDFAAHKAGGTVHMTHSDLMKGLAPFFAIREAVGYDIELMLDGHGFFQLPVALRIADAMKDIKPMWLEDVIRPDCIDTIRDFRDRSGLPLAVSEMLIGTEDYRLALEKRAADYIMIDPTWVGGISQTLKITDLAQAYNIPVVMHDCTGPLTLIAGVHVATARANVAWQETLRAHVRLRYPEMVTQFPEIKDGYILPPTGAGLGSDLSDELFAEPHLVRTTQA